MDVEKEIQNILDRNFERGDNAKAKEELLILFDVSNQKELLIYFHAYIDETQGFAPKPLNERRVDNFIKNKLPLQSNEITISIQEYEALKRDSENLNKVDFGN